LGAGAGAGAADGVGVGVGELKTYCAPALPVNARKIKTCKILFAAICITITSRSV
jgi:hypothetical protein